MALTTHFRNMSYIFAGDLVSRMFGFLAAAYLARVLGKSDFGEINIGLAVLAYALVVSDAGLSLLGAKKVSTDPEAAEILAGNILGARSLLSLLAFILAIVGIFVIIDSSEIITLIFIYLLFLAPAAFMLDWFFQGQQQMGIMATGRITGMLVYLGMVLLWVKEPGDTLTTAAAWVTGGAVNAFLLVFIFKRCGYRFRFSRQTFRFRSLLSESLPLGLSQLISQIALQFPVIYLGWVAALEDVAVFSAAFRLILLLMIFDRVFNTVFFPAISRQADQDPASLEIIVGRLLRLIATAALSLGTATVLGADLVVSFVFGDLYKASAFFFQVLTAYLVLTLISSVVGYTLVGMGYSKAFTRSFVVGMAAFLACIFLLSTGDQIFNVVISLIIYQLAALVVITWELNKHLKLSWLRNIVFPITLTTLIIIPLLMWIKILLAVKFAMIIFLAVPAIAWSAGITRDDIKYLKRIIG